MLDFFYKLMDNLAPLKAKKDPALACIIGFFAGGIGLGLYFWSFVDFIFPLAIAVAISITAGAVLQDDLIAWLSGALIASLYGYFRAKNSNDRIQSIT